MRNLVLLLTSLGLLGLGAAGFVTSSHSPAQAQAPSAPASVSCERVTRHLFLWDSPVRTPFRHSGRVDAYLPDDVDRAWMNVSVGNHVQADWSIQLYGPDGRGISESDSREATGPEAVDTHDLGNLSEGMYRFTWDQAGLVDGLHVDLEVRGCPPNS
jgi:hypothetical protein